MNMEEIVNKLIALRDSNYKTFQGSLIPSVDEGDVLGVRTPDLRAYAKEIKNSQMAEEFKNELPHKYFEENQLHAFLIASIKDFDKCIEEIERFLPYIDNWATCDQMNPSALKKNPDELLKYVKKWIKDDKTYTVRFAIKTLMNFYLDDLFDVKYLDMVAAVKNEEYYVQMMVAWYFATALAKQYDETVKYIEDHRLSDWTHKKTIQKARESFRVTDENKNYLKTLK